MQVSRVRARSEPLASVRWHRSRVCRAAAHEPVWTAKVPQTPFTHCTSTVYTHQTRVGSFLQWRKGFCMFAAREIGYTLGHRNPISVSTRLAPRASMRCYRSRARARATFLHWMTCCATRYSMRVLWVTSCAARKSLQELWMASCVSCKSLLMTFTQISCEATLMPVERLPRLLACPRMRCR